VELFGVVNASPDSLNEESIVRTPEEAQRRARQLVDEGVEAFAKAYNSLLETLEQKAGELSAAAR